jgi:Transposase DNA-binding
MRHTGRAVKAAKRMAENPSATLPAHMQTWKETIALYRLLDEEDVTSSRTDAAALATDTRTD